MSINLPRRRVPVPEIHAADIQNVSGTTTATPIAVTDQEAAVYIYSKLTAAGNLDTGVALYQEPHLAGACGQVYGSAVSMVLDAGFAPGGGGSLLIAQTNGIYDNSTASFGSADANIVVYGLKSEYIKGANSPTTLFPFSLNSNVAPTALFYDQGTGNMLNYIADAGTSSTKVGDVPLFHTATGTTFYIRIYSARG